MNPVGDVDQDIHQAVKREVKPGVPGDNKARTGDDDGQQDNVGREQGAGGGALADGFTVNGEGGAVKASGNKVQDDCGDNDSGGDGKAVAASNHQTKEDEGEHGHGDSLSRA